MMTDLTWYDTLIRPEWTPPAAVFGIVWPVLYTLMALSLFILLSGGKRREKTPAVLLFLIQLALNLSWSPVFFGAQSIGGALMIVCALWFFLAATIFSFLRFSKTAALLLVPYFLWICLAVALNAAFFWLN